MLVATLGFMPGVCHQEQDDTAHLARGLPALLTVFDAVLPRDVQRVIEHQLGCFETHAMLALVDFVFGIVPRKQV